MGYNHVRVRGLGYWEGGYAAPIDLDVKQPGDKNLLLKVRKQPTFWVRFDAAPDSLKNTEVFKKTETGESQVGGADSGQWSTPAPKWDATIEIRVMRYNAETRKREEILPWTTLTASPQNWPQVVRIP
jgi:hypothetical protein